MTAKEFKVIAIDGGAASGKSSTARALAKRGHWMHVDTGTHYRAITAACLEQGISAEDEAGLNEFLGTLELSTVVDGTEGRIAVRGKLIEAALLRTEAVNAHVSRYAARPEVREAVKRYQRGQVEVARERGFNGLVMDGRDIGSVILPDADLKVFLHADEATRQARRAQDGEMDSVGERDRLDQARKTAPLMVPEGAFCIDNSLLSLEQVVDRIWDALHDGE
jgi:cytidylate kinase